MDPRPDDPRPEVEAKTEGEQKLDEIRTEMDQTRAALADKLETLQERVVGTVETAQATVEQAVATVQDTVQAAKRTLDLKYQTEQRPWLMVGLAMVAGSAAGYLTGRARRRPAVRTERNEAVPSAAPPEVGYGEAPLRAAVLPSPAPAATPGLFAEEWRQLKGMGIGVGMALARDWLKDAAPKFAERIDEVMNSATPKLGGVLIKGPLLRPAPSGQAPARGTGGV